MSLDFISTSLRSSARFRSWLREIFLVLAGMLRARTTPVARFLGVPQPSIAFLGIERQPPRSDLFPAMAKALGVRIEDLIADSSPKVLANRLGPIGEVQRAFEEVRKLPRKQQRKVVEFVFAFVNEFKRKAS